MTLKEYISKQQYYYLKTNEATLPKVYGLPKMHKKDYPLRIIVSSDNSTLHWLASFLNKILHELIIL